MPEIIFEPIIGGMRWGYAWDGGICCGEHTITIGEWLFERFSHLACFICYPSSPIIG